MDVLKNTTVDQLQRMVEAVAEYAPELEGRAHRAVATLIAGKVARVIGDQYEVVSSDGDGSYRVNGTTCDCPDFKHRAPEHRGSRWCKHRLAVLFLRKLERQQRRPSARRARVATFRRVTRRPIRKAA